MYVDIPQVIHEALRITILSSRADEQMLKNTIEEIKKITNTECESALSYLKEAIASQV
jgi:hypothetical protein